MIRCWIPRAGLFVVLVGVCGQNMPQTGVLYTCNQGTQKLKLTKCTSGSGAGCDVQFFGNQNPPEPTGNTRMSREQLAGMLRTCVLPNGQPALATVRSPSAAPAAARPSADGTAFRVGDIAMAYSMFGWIQVRILEVKGDQYRVHYMDQTNMWVKARNLKRPTAMATRSGVGALPPGAAKENRPKP